MTKFSLMIPKLLAFFGTFVCFANMAVAVEIQTNAVVVSQAPVWLTRLEVQRVVDRVERFLEWDIRRISVRWYSDQGQFEKVHGFGPAVLAIAKRSDHSVHVGPKVQKENFAKVFGHELAHVVLFQKYKDAVPKWLEEGLANYVSKHGMIDYKLLGAQPLSDVKALEHPFGSGQAPKVEPKVHYMASTALMEMIASRCRIHDLLQLSVGQKLERYLSTFCGIADLNLEYKKWVERKNLPKKL
ncbi:MAG: hypothetical protein AB1540_10680 [Bdellovibrionota bacterium]